MPTGHVPESRTCPHCGANLPPRETELMGTVFYAIRRCQCELDEYDREQQEFQNAERQRRLDRLFQGARLGKRFRACTFDSFTLRPGTEEAYAIVKDFAKLFKAGTGQGYLLAGGYGSGKTHLVAATVQHLIERFVPAVFVVVPELLDQIKATYNRQSDITESSIVSAIQGADLVVLDDLGAEQVTDWMQVKLYTIINGLYGRMASVLVTTNCTPGELEDRLGGKTYSRLVEMLDVLPVTAKDYRMRKLRVPQEDR